MEQIKDVIKNYFNCWNEAYLSKNGEAIKDFMSEKFVGYWAHSGIDAPEVYDYNYDINGVINQTDRATKTFEITSIHSRKNGLEYLVSGREINFINDVPYSAQCMFVWRNENNDWKLLREYIELER